VHGRGRFIRRAVAIAATSLIALSAFALTAHAVDNRQTDLVSPGAVNGNGPLDATWGGSSADGTHVFFTTQEQLSVADTDSKYDVYERFNGVTTLLSAGAINGNGAFDAGFSGASADGSRVYFQTAEKLVSSDTDNVIDVYERAGGVTTQITTGNGNDDTVNDSFFLGVSTDGTKVFFSSYDQLATTDTDGSKRDVYVRSGGVTTQISTGGNGAFGADFDGMTPDGSHIYFHTDEKLAGTDTDSTRDVYDASGGVVTQVSRGSTGGNGGQIPIYQGSTADGSHVYFQTTEILEPSDTDAFLDVYDRSGGATTEVSLGPAGGNGNWDANFSGASADGSKVWFMTREAMVAGDTDGGCEDSLGNPTLQCLDVYERSGGNTTWVSSGGNGAFEASFAAASQDGSKVFFQSAESLTGNDADGDAQDVFERSGGTTTLVSIGPAGGTGPYSSDLAAISKDGVRVFFATYESLVSEDNDGNWQDVYERYGGETTLISTGPATTNQAAIAFLDGSTADGTKVFFHTDEKLVSSDTDAAEDIYASTQLLSGYPRPKGATPAVFSLVPAYQPCVTGNYVHGAPLAYPSCNPPLQESGVLTVGTFDSNGHDANSVSQVKLRVIAGVPGPPDDSDVAVTITVSDVLCRGTNAACPGGPLSDYAGQVLVKFPMRVTDKFNGSPTVESATTQDFPIQIPVQCVATPASSTQGGKCTVQTTMDAFYPGGVLDTKRANWEVGQMTVLDPGPNGTGFGSGCPSTCGDGDETVFMREGIFIP
jgi:hypothetical protein